MDTRMEILEAIRDDGELFAYTKKSHNIILERLIDVGLIRPTDGKKYKITEEGRNYLGIRENYMDRKLRRKKC